MLDQDQVIRCPILTYTSVVPKDDGDTNFRTTAQKLETDIETLLTNGFTPISLREAYGSNTLDNPCVKPVCIVFLGGYENNYTVAFPILKRYNIPVSIFVATDFVGVREYPSVKGYSPHFDWKQAQEMCDSGLVEIFPLWHMFDRGKSIDELTKKISLISANIQGCDPAFAIAYNDCTDRELWRMNELGVKICISDCSNITSARVSCGMLPAVSVDYTFDVADTICLYTKLCRDAFEKETAHTFEVEYEEPSSDILAESVSLPIDKKPMVKNYLRHAFPLSVLQSVSKERAERLVLNEYIDVVYKPWDDWYDYHNYLYSSWECLDYRRMTSDLLRKNGINVIEYIIHALSLGYYADAWLDTYYIPGKPGYARRHMTHGILIFAYTADSREFRALSYNSAGHYDELRIPVKSVFMGCSNAYFHYINLIKNNPGIIVEYNARELCGKLRDYLNSVCHDDNKRYNKKSSQQYYNYEATQKFIDFFSEKTSKNGYVHLTSLYSFAEQKRIMMWRVKFIAEKEKLQLRFDEAYGLVVNQTDNLVNLGIKYNLTQSPKICNRMKDVMVALCNNERNAIEHLLTTFSKS